MNAFQYALVGIIIVALFATQWLEWSNNRYAETKQKAFDLYVETGFKATAFGLLSRRAAKAAERRRLALICSRERETRQFQTECPCPACTRVGLHWIHEGSGLARVTRECIFCGHKWSQE